MIVVGFALSQGYDWSKSVKIWNRQWNKQDCMSKGKFKQDLPSSMLIRLRFSHIALFFSLSCLMNKKLSVVKVHSWREGVEPQLSSSSLLLFPIVSYLIQLLCHAHLLYCYFYFIFVFLLTFKNQSSLFIIVFLYILLCNLFMSYLNISWPVLTKLYIFPANLFKEYAFPYNLFCCCSLFLPLYLLLLSWFLVFCCYFLLTLCFSFEIMKLNL